jgi:Uma2 family endonuclease
MEGAGYNDTVTQKGTATIDDLLNMPEDGMKHELVDGEILVSPTGVRHSEIAGKILYIIAGFLEESPIGKVLTPDVGIWLSDGNLRSPDVTFVRNEKLPDGKSPDTFGEFVPDLAVEVLSPKDSMRQVASKIGEFLDCGIPMVWLVDPAGETVTVYRSLSDTQRLGRENTITGGQILPGFRCRVARFF